MLPQLHRLSIPVIDRKEIKWLNCKTFEAYPIQELHQAFTDELFNILENLEQEKVSWTNIHPRFKSLLKLKMQLDEVPWHKPPVHDHSTMSCFAHDLMFYFMITSLVNQATVLFEGFFNDDQIPSITCLYHRVKHSNKWLTAIYTKHIPECSWIEKLLNQAESPYMEQYQKMQRLIKAKQLPELVQALLHDHLNTLEILPETRSYEMVLLRKLIVINSYIERFVLFKQWSVLRELIHTCLTTAYVNTLIIDDYMMLIQSYNVTINYVEEHRFWKEALKQYEQSHTYHTVVLLPSHRLYKQIIQVCKNQSHQQAPSECRQLCKYDLDWIGHPFTLLRLLHPIICRGQLLINGSSDLSSLARFITSLGRIKKVRQNGHLADSSILTYLKKMQSGDIDLQHAPKT